MHGAEVRCRSLGEEIVETFGGVGECRGFDAEPAFDGDKQVSEEALVVGGRVAGEGEVASVFETAACDEGGEVVVGMAAGVAHAGAKHDNGVVEERLPVLVGE